MITPPPPPPPPPSAAAAAANALRQNINFYKDIK
jgi:hypothetical protein